MRWGGEESEEGVLFLIFFVGAEMMFCLVVRLVITVSFFFLKKVSLPVTMELHMGIGKDHSISLLFCRLFLA